VGLYRQIWAGADQGVYVVREQDIEINKNVLRTQPFILLRSHFNSRCAKVNIIGPRVLSKQTALQYFLMNFRETRTRTIVPNRRDFSKGGGERTKLHGTG
jgi:hypothetical protein